MSEPSSTPPRRVALVATLDSKGAEASYLHAALERHGVQPWLVDVSLGRDQQPDADVSCAEVARAGGGDWALLRDLPRSEAMAVMAEGAGRVLVEAVDRGEIHAVLAIGGGTGTWMATTAMRSLPLGFPKLMVSTIAGGDGHRDIAVLPSVADIAGLNAILRPILNNAAAAVSGMARASRPAGGDAPSRAVVAMTMFGVTTAGGLIARQVLEEAGCEVVVFHATGAGGATMEDLVRQGRFAAVLDWTTSEITDLLTGGICTAGDTRLDAFAETGVPIVLVPGAVDVINVLAPIPDRFAGRTHHWHLPVVPLIRTDEAESRRIGAWIAHKLNRATGPVRILVPRAGFSSLDAPGEPFENPAADAAFIAGLEEELDPSLKVELLDGNINDEVFARAAALALLECLPKEH